MASPTWYNVSASRSAHSEVVMAVDSVQPLQALPTVRSYPGHGSTEDTKTASDLLMELACDTAIELVAHVIAHALGQSAAFIRQRVRHGYRRQAGVRLSPSGSVLDGRQITQAGYPA